MGTINVKRQRSLRRLCGLVQKAWTETLAPVEQIEIRFEVTRGQVLRWVRGLNRPAKVVCPVPAKTSRREQIQRAARKRALWGGKRERAVHLLTTTTRTFADIAAEVGCGTTTIARWGEGLQRPDGAYRRPYVGAGPAFQTLNWKLRSCGIPLEERRRVIAAARAEREMRHAA